MGNNTLTTITGGIGRKEQVNQYKDALVGDILPRNTDGEVEALAGNIGTDAIPFKELNATVINKVATRKKKEFLTAGSHSFTVPGGVSELKIFACSGGGGGSSGSGGARGGAGGAGGVFLIGVHQEDSISISVGAGGAGGTATSGNPTSGVAGSSGGTTSISKNGQQIITLTGGQGGSFVTADGHRSGAISLGADFVLGGGSGGVGSRTDDAASVATGGFLGRQGSLYVYGNGGGGGKGDGGVWGGSGLNYVSAGGGGGFSNGSNGVVASGGVSGTGGAGGNGGAIIYYDLPSWATDPNNGVDA